MPRAAGKDLVVRRSSKPGLFAVLVASAGVTGVRIAVLRERRRPIREVRGDEAELVGAEVDACRGPECDDAIGADLSERGIPGGDALGGYRARVVEPSIPLVG